MRRRELLTLAPVAAAAPLLAPLASRAAAADPVLEAIVRAGGKVRPAPSDWAHWIGIVYDKAGSIVGYLPRSGGCVQLCTPAWPPR